MIITFTFDMRDTHLILRSIALKCCANGVHGQQFRTTQLLSEIQEAGIRTLQVTSDDPPDSERNGTPHVSSSSYICHGVGPLVDPFRSHVSRSLFKGLP